MLDINRIFENNRVDKYIILSDLANSIFHKVEMHVAGSEKIVCIGNGFKIGKVKQIHEVFLKWIWI